MRLQSATLWWLPALLCAAAGVGAQEASQTQTPDPQANDQTVQPEPDHAWLDKTQQGVQNLASKSAQHLDRLFGPEEDEAAYKAVTGSVAPAVLWDEFEGW